MGNSLINKFVAQLPWLEDVSQQARKSINDTVGAAGPAGKTVKDFLNGVWLGHPLHPVMTDLPVGAWTMAQMFDLLSALDSNNQDLDRAADLLVGAGVVSSAGAAVAGLADWSDMHGQAARVGLLHGMMNSAALVLYLASLAVRLNKGNRGLARVLSGLGYTVTVGSAWVGGDMVYKLGVGVNRNAWVERPTKFKNAIAEDDLEEGKAVKVEVDGTTVAIYKHEDGVHAFAGICPHAGGPLWEGEFDGHEVTCPWHGSVFDITNGDLLHGPATASLPCFEVRRYGGQIQVRLAEQKEREQQGNAS